MRANSKVILYPWDPDSFAHRQWLYRQRVDCSWHYEKVENVWREQQIKGEKCLYWIAIRTDHPDACEIPELSPELKKFGYLSDTAVSINAASRTPSRQSFIPIGHISLDSKNDEAADLGLDIPLDGVYWIKTFFVQHSLQSKGIGRAAMDEVENMATGEPLLAKTLMLDTVEKNDQLREEFAMATFGAVPKVSNQDWYSRRGYRSIGIIQNHYDVADRNGKKWDIKTIFMRKDIC